MAIIVSKISVEITDLIGEAYVTLKVIREFMIADEPR